jgi:ribonuclease HII
MAKDKQTNIIRGDSLSVSIGAASIIGKVFRDDLMLKYHEKYPNYGFDKHKGYGTASHLKAVQTYGVCPIHRRSFEPIKSLVLQSAQPTA